MRFLTLEVRGLILVKHIPRLTKQPVIWRRLALRFILLSRENYESCVKPPDRRALTCYHRMFIECICSLHAWGRPLLYSGYMMLMDALKMVIWNLASLKAALRQARQMDRWRNADLAPKCRTVLPKPWWMRKTIRNTVSSQSADYITKQKDVLSAAVEGQGVQAWWRFHQAYRQL